MKTNQLPAGLMDNNVEFFASEGIAYCLTGGRRVPIDELPETILIAIEHSISEIKLKAITAMGITDRVPVIKQFIICNYGGFDNTADMVDGKLQDTEYWACPHRGKCPHEGILCDNLITGTGERLSKREVEVIGLIADGFLDKEIANKINRSKDTVATHNRNIRIKTGLSRKPDITRFAFQKNII